MSPDPQKPNDPRDLCFVLMPFGKKPDAAGKEVDFDAVYSEVIRPAVQEAGLEPIRADEETMGGFIHKPMFERLVLCEFAVADLTNANANVFYELGVRHAARPWSTVLLSAEGHRIPFDLGPMRALPYRIGEDGRPVDAEAARSALVEHLREARKAAIEKPASDSPLYQLLDGYPDRISHEKTDVFRRVVAYSAEKKEALRLARKEGRDAVHGVEAGLGDLREEEFGVLVDLFLSYRAVSAWDDMVRLWKALPPVLAGTVTVREQYAFALNRLGERDEAERVLRGVLEDAPSSETYGLLGRVYKDRWEDAVKAGDAFMAEGYLEQAIDTYLKGFETDWRDAYPGINAVTLMELRDPPDPRRTEVLPVVRYAVERKIARGTPDYWDHATRLELAVLAGDRRRAYDALRAALMAMREPWEGETTTRNLRLIREAREHRGEDAAWIGEIEKRLSPAE